MTWPPTDTDFDRIANTVFNSEECKPNKLNTVLVYWDSPKKMIIFEPIHFAKTEYLSKVYNRESDNTSVKIIIGEED